MSLAFVRGIHQWPVNSLHKGPVTRNVYIWWCHHVLCWSYNICKTVKWLGYMKLKMFIAMISTITWCKWASDELHSCIVMRYYNAPWCSLWHSDNKGQENSTLWTQNYAAYLTPKHTEMERPSGWLPWSSLRCWRFALSQWETSLQSNAISHWLGASLQHLQWWTRQWSW